MTIKSSREPGSNRTTTDKDRHHRLARRALLASAVRSGLVIVVASSFYALAPLGREIDGAIAVQLAGWLLVFVAVVGWELRAVIHSTYPGLRAGEAIAISLPLFILIFASTYFATARMSPASFTEPLTRLDALYFTVTVFATVGFGDIAPRTDQARMLVTTQMLTDLIVIGFIAKILLGAVQIRRQALNTGSQQPRLLRGEDQD